MAFSDYHACDQCGEKKTFYDANMDVEWCPYQMAYLYQGYRIYALCHKCEKTHEIVILPKGLSNDHN